MNTGSCAREFGGEGGGVVGLFSWLYHTYVYTYFTYIDMMRMGWTNSKKIIIVIKRICWEEGLNKNQMIRSERYLEGALDKRTIFL